MDTETVARRLRVTPEYLRQCERSGFPYPLALRAARLYGCPLTYFLTTGGKGPETAKRQAGGRTNPRQNKTAPGGNRGGL